MKNKYLATLLAIALLLNVTLVPAEAIETFSLNNKEFQSVPNKLPLSEEVIPPQLEKELKEEIKNVYGSDRVEEIYAHIFQIALKAKKERPEALKKDDLNRNSDWYKDEIIYMFYADQFGVYASGKANTFKDTISMLDYLKTLGVTTLYILPFADSPMADSGFDVKDPRNVRSDLGGMKEFQEFITAARNKGFKIKADLVLNHFSDQHVWFQQALKGDAEKLDYFVTREEMPEFTKYLDEKLGTVVEYKEPTGEISKRRLIFPEQTDSHYRKVTINNKDYYLYHTFYPFQLDINWENPEVLYYNLETIAYWANLGIDIFRMDAIPYLIKDKGTNAENQPKTHSIIAILSEFLQATAPRSVIQAEACQMPNKILPYFGKERTYKEEILGKEKEITRTNEVQIAYHFPYMPAIWASLITEDNRYFWQAHKQTPGIPDSASWAIFLRVHDELTLEMCNKKIREIIYENLEPKGAEFRKGFGVSGRLANFLDNNPDRIGMAFSILMSMPGIPIIYYGDEIGIQNNYYNARKFARLREAKQKNSSKNKAKMLSYFDSRDINRGAVSKRALYTASKDNRIFKKVQKLIRVRKQNPVLCRGDFSPLKTKNKEVFSYTRTLGDEKVLVINNLSNNRVYSEIDLPSMPLWIADKEVYLEDLLSNKKIKVNVSITNKKVSLRLKPYDTLWLKLETKTAE